MSGILERDWEVLKCFENKPKKILMIFFFQVLMKAFCGFCFLYFFYDTLKKSEFTFLYLLTGSSFDRHLSGSIKKNLKLFFSQTFFLLQE